jgi:hypothetical protein
MSSIQIKNGQCIDCPLGTERPLTARRCHTHYWQYRASLKKHASPVEIDGLAEDKAEAQWFADQINQMPKHCENCGEYLNQYAPWGAKSYVAHILAKRDNMFPSVKLHPLNRVFLCIQCHTNYDNWGDSAKVMAMAAYPIILERFHLIFDDIDPKELIHLPPYLITAA